LAGKNFRKHAAPTALARDPGGSQHPFGNPATEQLTVREHDVRRPALGFAPQPYGWFAFSRMMTQQARHSPKTALLLTCLRLTKDRSGEEKLSLGNTPRNRVMSPDETYVGFVRCQIARLEKN